MNGHRRATRGGGDTERQEFEAWAKFSLVVAAVAALFLVIASGSWGASSGYYTTDRSTPPFTDFVRDLFVNHGVELLLAALIIAAAALGGLQIAREEEYD